MSFALVHGNFDTTDFGIGNKVSFSSARYIGYVFESQHPCCNDCFCFWQWRKISSDSGAIDPEPAMQPTIVPANETLAPCNSMPNIVAA
jgi:hypothetical protein